MTAFGKSHCNNQSTSNGGFGPKHPSALARSNSAKFPLQAPVGRSCCWLLEVVISVEFWACLINSVPHDFLYSSRYGRMRKSKFRKIRMIMDIDSRKKVLLFFISSVFAAIISFMTFLFWDYIQYKYYSITNPKFEAIAENYSCAVDANRQMVRVRHAKGQAAFQDKNYIESKKLFGECVVKNINFCWKAFRSHDYIVLYSKSFIRLPREISRELDASEKSIQSNHCAYLSACYEMFPKEPPEWKDPAARLYNPFVLTENKLGYANCHLMS